MNNTLCLFKKIVLSIFLLAWLCTSLKGQNATISVNVQASKFTDYYEKNWSGSKGQTYYFRWIKFYYTDGVNDVLIKEFVKDVNTFPYYKSIGEMTLAKFPFNGNFSIKVVYNAYFYHWWIGGDDKSQDIDKQFIQQYTFSSEGTASGRINLTDHRQDESFVDLKISISKYKPTISTSANDAKACIDAPITLSASPNKPTVYPDPTYNWEFGIGKKVYEDDPDFRNKLYNYLSTYMQNCNTSNGNNYSDFAYDISNLDFAPLILNHYSFENSSSADEEAKIEAVIDAFFVLFLSTNYSFDECHREAIRNSFSEIPISDRLVNRITWKSLGTSTANSYTLTPKQLDELKNTNDTLSVYFRVRAKSDFLNSDYSNIKVVSIYPSAPTAAITSEMSCPYSQTGKITLRNVSSPLSNQDYSYRLLKCDGSNCPPITTSIDDTSLNGWGNAPVQFSGSSLNIDNLNSGTYKLYLTYENPTYRNGCISNNEVVVGTKNSLIFNATVQNHVSCHGGSDGAVSVSVSSSAGTYATAIVTGDTNTNTSFTGLSKGAYTIKVSDECHAASSPLTASVTINEPTALSIASSSTIGSSCGNQPNGSITLTSSGGILPNETESFDFYLYKNGNGTSIKSKTDGATSWTSENLSAGDYSVTVKMHNKPSCEGISKAFTIADNTIKWNKAATITHVNCFGEATGQIVVNSPSNGAGIYTYGITNKDVASNKIEQDTNEFSGLIAGTYVVSVSNKINTCTDNYSQEFIVNANGKIQASIEHVDATCFETNTGSATASVTGGIAPYVYAWYQDGAQLAQTTNKIERLYADTYKLSVTDNLGCKSGETTIVVNEPDPLVINSITAQDVVCYGEKGSIHVEAKGGTIPYSYYYGKNDVTLQPFVNDEKSIADGVYVIKVIDKNKCEQLSEGTITITQPTTVLSFVSTLSDFNGKNISCYNSADGSVTLTASGGNGKKGVDGTSYTGYKFKIDNKDYQTSNQFGGLQPGNHTVYVSDGRGCEVNSQVVLTQPTQLMLNEPTITSIICYGQSTGEISLSAQGGIEPYQYSIDNTYHAQTVFKNLNANTYSTSVKDKNGCTASKEAIIKNLYQAIQIGLSKEDVRCYGENNGTIVASVQGGSGTYHTSWQKREGDSWIELQSSGGSIRNLSPSVYRYSVVDALNCPVVYQSIEIIQPTAALSFQQVKVEDIRCKEEAGLIRTTATGGNEGYTFYTKRSSETETKYVSGSLLTAGSYTILVRDSKGCETVWQNIVAITEPTEALDFAYTLSNYNGYNVSCYGQTNGRIEVNATGGNGSAYSGYTYLLSNQAQSSSLFLNLGATQYSISVKDGRGCIITKNVTLTQPSATLNLSVDKKVDSKCFNDASGQVVLKASGGNSPYVFKKNEQDYSNLSSFDLLSVGTYTFTVKDQNNCTATTDTSIGNQLPEPTVLLTTEEINCYGKSDGSIQSSISGGSGNFALRWFAYENEQWVDLNRNDNKIQNLAPTTYKLEITDKAGCPPIEKQAEIVQRVTPLVVTLKSKEDIRCKGESGKIDIEASGSHGNYVFYQSLQAQNFIAYQPNEPLPAGIYQIKAVDEKGCETLLANSVEITEPSLALASTFSVSDFNGYNVSCFGNSDGYITCNVNGGNGANYSGYWYKVNQHDWQTVSQFDRLPAGLYSLQIKDGRGCVVSKDITLIQPASDMSLQVTAIEPTTCSYDANGAVILQASGGAEPYRYSIDDREYSVQNKFSNLSVGDYTVYVQDKYGCKQLTRVSVSYTVQDMRIIETIQHVACYNGKDGSIATSVSSGGKSPFIFYWKELNRNGNFVGGLSKGNYSLRVTDAAGCIAEKKFDVKEPAQPLSLTATSGAACAETKNGFISPRASGGTPPYLYKIKDEQFSTEQVLSYPGTFVVEAQDSNGCTTNTSVVVNQKNTKPQINFLAATSRYASDTIVIKDVSVPAPNLVDWVFPKEIEVLSRTNTEAFVKLREVGDYAIKMSGHFDGCDYTIEKNLHIAPFDPSVKETVLLKGIESVILSPNPNNGNFTTSIKLYNKQKATITIVDMFSRIWYSSEQENFIEKEISISLPDALPGVYVLYVTAENGYIAKRFVISR